jgi:hypothetical protein
MVYCMHDISMIKLLVYNYDFHYRYTPDITEFF